MRILSVLIRPLLLKDEELDQFAQTVLKHYRSDRRHKPFSVSERLQNSGWLQQVPASLGKFEFVHPNFLEYFASRGLVAAPNELLPFVDEHLSTNNTSVLG
jgi:hypothetical protein